VHEDGAVAGILCIVAETSGRVLADRRLRALRVTGLRLAAVADVAAACAAGLEAITEENPHDLPWGQMYLAGEEGLSLVASHGALQDGHPGPALREVLESMLQDATPRELPGALALPLMARESCPAARPR
jgi:hypothetical protein